MNSIVLMGRLVKEPEIKVTPSEKTVCTFTLAVERPFAKKETDFINIVAWGKTAEVVGNYVQKGQRLLVEGRLQIRNYVAKDGNKRYVTEVVANSVEFIEKKEHEEKQSSMESMGKAVAFDEEIPF